MCVWLVLVILDLCTDKGGRVLAGDLMVTSLPTVAEAVECTCDRVAVGKAMLIT